MIKVVVTKRPQNNVILAIKSVRAITGYGLRESKDCIEGIPLSVESQEIADRIVEAICENGGDARIEGDTTAPPRMVRKVQRSMRLAMYRANALGALLGSSSAWDRYMAGTLSAMGFPEWCAREAEIAAQAMIEAETKAAK